MTENEYVLVVGGAGYIGSHTNLELFTRGFKTVVFDNLVYGHRSFARWGEFVEGDLNDAGCLRTVFKKYRIKAVMHFAAYAYVGESVEKPEKYYVNNVSNTLNLLRVMREFDVKYFVFSSSCATYGNPVEIPITEDHPQNPINPYGHSKVMVETILESYSLAYGLRFVSLRYFNAAGADLQGRIGEWHDPETHLIPLALDAAAGSGDTLKIFGNDYETPDGTCIRDYIHIADLAHAHILALEYLYKTAESQIFNLGNGKGYSVKEVIDTVQNVTGRIIDSVNAPRRPGDPPVLLSSSEKIRKILSWNPEYPELQTIIETAWNWHQNITRQDLS